MRFVLASLICCAVAALASYPDFENLATETTHVRDTASLQAMPSPRFGKRFHPDVRSLSLSAFGMNLDLDLALSHGLLGPDYKEIRVGENGEETIHRTREDIELCYYQGTVRGKPESYVAVHTCNGLQGVIGVDGETFVVAPEGFDTMSSTSRDVREFSVTASRHTVTRLTDAKTPQEWCGVKKGNVAQGTSAHMHSMSAGHDHSHDHDHDHSHAHDHTTYSKSTKGSTRKPALEATGDAWVELYNFNDVARYQRFGNAVEENVLNIVNIANGLYGATTFGARKPKLQLVAQKTFRTTNGWSTTTAADPGNGNVQAYDAEVLLPDVRAYCNSNDPITPNSDVTTMLSGKPFKLPTLGLAYVPGACGSSRYGVVTDYGPSVTAQAFTAQVYAHEVGHTLGMNHDDDPDFHNCPDTFVMASGACPSCPQSSWPTRFSTCSVSDFTSAIASPSFNCLTESAPTRNYTVICGNGLVEGLEQCDCLNNICTNDPCCNGTSCRLLATSVCSNSEPCCLNCQYRLNSTQFACRNATSDCDPVEYCDGTSGSCPADEQCPPGESASDKAKTFFKNNWQWFVLGAGVIIAFFVLRGLWRCMCGDDKKQRQSQAVPMAQVSQNYAGQPSYPPQQAYSSPRTAGSQGYR